jgi:hypothetical protein
VGRIEHDRRTEDELREVAEGSEAISASALELLGKASDFA